MSKLKGTHAIVSGHWHFNRYSCRVDPLKVGSCDDASRRTFLLAGPSVSYRAYPSLYDAGYSVAKKRTEMVKSKTEFMNVPVCKRAKTGPPRSADDTGECKHGEKTVKRQPRGVRMVELYDQALGGEFSKRPMRSYIRNDDNSVLAETEKIPCGDQSQVGQIRYAKTFYGK